MGVLNITLNDDADYVQNAVHDGTLKIVHRDDENVCEAPGNSDYGVCGATAFVFVPSKAAPGLREEAFCLHCAADFLKANRYSSTEEQV